jgi:hypothetical protein
MSEADRSGPQVDASETLYRLITTPDWWVAEERRPSSAAFDEPKFSVNMASRTTVEHTKRQLREDLARPDGGIVSFGCGRARELGFDARDERDERFPHNVAHAHVYYDGGRNSRKRNARRLAKECAIVLEPTFEG